MVPLPGGHTLFTTEDFAVSPPLDNGVAPLTVLTGCFPPPLPPPLPAVAMPTGGIGGFVVGVLEAVLTIGLMLVLEWADVLMVFGGYERVCVAVTTTVACVTPCEVSVNSFRTAPVLVRGVEDLVTVWVLLTEVVTERVVVVETGCACFWSGGVGPVCWCLLEGTAIVFTPLPPAITVLVLVFLLPLLVATLVDTVPPDPAFL